MPTCGVHTHTHTYTETLQGMFYAHNGIIPLREWVRVCFRVWPIFIWKLKVKNTL